MSRYNEQSVLYGLSVHLLLLFISSVFAASVLNLEEGASCGPQLVCTKISECFTVNKDIGFRQKLQTCGYTKSHMPIMCCSPKLTDRSPVLISEEEANKTISEKMCEKYASYVFGPPAQAGWSIHGSKPKKQDMCGRIAQPLIVGGEHAKTREFPHMVQIGYGSERRPPRSPEAWLCGGSLISERFVLSAAHCTTDPQNKRLARWARMGVVDTRKIDQGLEPQILKIVEWINRTDYTATGYNDIVLFKLEKNVNLNPYVRPICLQVNEYIEADNAIATGWGKLFEGSRRFNTPILRKVSLNIVEKDDCIKAVGNTLYPQGIKDTQLCAGGEAGHDTCQGDSGGPLQIPIKEPYCMYSLIGVTSGGGRCGSDLPGIYTRVSKYVPWIEGHVWPNEK